MPAAGFEPTVAAIERPQTHALDRAVTGIRRQLYVGFWIISAIFFSVAIHPNTDLRRRIGEVSHTNTHSEDKRTSMPWACFELAISSDLRLRPHGCWKSCESLVLVELQSETRLLLIILRLKASLSAFWYQTLFLVFSSLTVRLCQHMLLLMCRTAVAAVKSTWISVFVGKQRIEEKYNTKFSLTR